MSGLDLFMLYLLVLIRIANCEWIPGMENTGLHEGDMVLTPGQKLAIEQRNNGFAVTSKNEFQHWPVGKPIPYEITSSIGAAGVDAINAAIKDYEKETCLHFIKRTNQRAYLSFYRGNGCHSPVGYRGFKNSISLDIGCWKKGVVMHEIAHSLGIMHEQNRPDRDDYVRIIWKNILPEGKGMFVKESSKNIDSLGVPYDLCSMMHYSKDAFGAGRITIETIDKSKQDWIGQRDGMSELDKIQINKMYQCTNYLSSCSNSNSNCEVWARQGYCSNNKQKSWMEQNCCLSCLATRSSCGCRDRNEKCESWEKLGECWRAKDYMSKNCQKSCKLC